MYRVSTDHDPGNLPNDTRRVLRERTFEPRSENNYDGSPSIQDTSSFTHCQPPSADFSKFGEPGKKHAKSEHPTIKRNRLPAAPPKPNRRPSIKAQNARCGLKTRQFGFNVLYVTFSPAALVEISQASAS